MSRSRHIKCSPSSNQMKSTIDNNQLSLIPAQSSKANFLYSPPVMDPKSAHANGDHAVYLSAATKLRRIVEDPNAFLMCPGVYDGFSARIALQVGFDGLYMVCPPFSSLFHTTATDKQ